MEINEIQEQIIEEFSVLEDWMDAENSIYYNGCLFDRAYVDYSKTIFDNFERHKIKKITFKKGLFVIPAMAQSPSCMINTFISNEMYTELDKNNKETNYLAKHYILPKKDIYRNFIKNIGNIEFCVIYGIVGEENLIMDGYYQGMKASKLINGKYYIETDMGIKIICQYYTPICNRITKL